jgi:hypothetical protein
VICTCHVHSATLAIYMNVTTPLQGVVSSPISYPSTVSEPRTPTLHQPRGTAYSGDGRQTEHTPLAHHIVSSLEAPSGCFAWTMTMEKVLTADNLQKRIWPHQDHCALCNRSLETCIHLALLCPFAKSVWRLTLAWGHFDENLVISSEEPTKLTRWWEVSQAKIPKGERRQFNGIVIYTILGAWILWNHRNRCIFDGLSPNIANFLIHAGDERRLWETAGAKGLTSLVASLSHVG